jgi:hypothetical protein
MSTPVRVGGKLSVATLEGTVGLGRIWSGEQTLITGSVDTNVKSGQFDDAWASRIAEAAAGRLDYQLYSLIEQARSPRRKLYQKSAQFRSNDYRSL